MLFGDNRWLAELTLFELRFLQPLSIYIPRAKYKLVNSATSIPILLKFAAALVTQNCKVTNVT